MRPAAYANARQQRLGQAKAATARSVGTEDLRTFDPDVRLRLPAPKAAPRPFARARATNVEQPSCPRTRNLALSCTRERRKWPRNRVLARIAAPTAPFRRQVSPKPQVAQIDRAVAPRSRAGSVPERGSVAIFAPFSRTTRTACRTAHAAKPRPVATGSTPPPTRSSGESPPPARRMPLVARREAPPHSLSMSSSSWRLWMSSFV